jgi:succinoglycan biosynthesis protein ExoM
MSTGLTEARGRQCDPVDPATSLELDVAICVLTYRRPMGLERLLDSLRDLRFHQLRPSSLEVVVVDNDPAQSAREVCARATPRLGWPLRYVIEPVRGIAQARNRALASVATHVDHIVFIDDDEIAAPGWLDALLSVQHEFGADTVAGPVVPLFEENVPSWLRGAFERDRHSTGTVLRSAAAGNVLILRSTIAEAGLRFDERFALTGGEDTLFFRRLATLGARIVWADDALVYETVPPARATLGWVLRRAFRTGITWSTVEFELDPRPSVLAGRVARSLIWTAIGISTLALGLVRGRRTALAGARRICWAVGCIAGLAGVRITEYRVSHGC